VSALAYKVLTAKGYAHHGGHGKWALPNGQPGAWKSVRGELIPCERGLHLCRKTDLIHWLGPAIFLAEYEGEPLAAGDKIVVRKARLVKRLDAWNERTARLFAADCAEHALRQLRKSGIELAREPFATTIRVARAFARGEASEEERSAAWSAARSAESAARSAESAAWSAESAAWSWQTKRLFEYLDGKRG
jgi:hypothetical protein